MIRFDEAEAVRLLTAGVGYVLVWPCGCVSQAASVPWIDGCWRPVPIFAGCPTFPDGWPEEHARVAFRQATTALAGRTMYTTTR